MAKTGAVWGIDLGQCALKALRCRAGDTPDTIVAEGFDYVEYPKMLSQPDANPAELIKEALETFLSRNSVKGDRVAISVSGQSGLSRFIKLPPVEAKKIPDIVKYEAKQQIPFQLEDVVWDYQQMAGGSVEEGFALETEVGLFAMKRDQVYRALRPFLDAGIEIDIVQLTPVALYNFVTFDQMPDIPPADQYSSDDPPPSVIVMSLGADMSDLVVSNGFRVWQRTVNLGGNHFTKALTKQMKLTFAKAEHLKRNAMKAEDPKAVFQAMRPVFSELLAEVQRSLNFFQNLDRTAKLDRVVPLGNAMKLRGLHKYLAQNLGLDVAEVDGYKKLTGSEVTASPAFKENMLSYGVCYGLCIQGLGKGRLSTNLLPREIIKDRLIRAKKPWAVAAVAALLFGCMVGYFGKWREWNSAHEDDAYTRAFSAASSAQSLASAAKNDYGKAKDDRDAAWAVGNKLAGIGERRVAWAELLKAVNDCLPHLPPLPPGKKPQDIPIEDRGTIYVDAIDCQYFPDLTARREAMQKKATADEPKAAAQGAGDSADTATSPPGDAATTPASDSTTGSTSDAGGGGGAAAQNSGWVVQIKAHHFHNQQNESDIAQEYVRRTFLHELKEKNDLMLGDTDEKHQPIPISTKDLGIELPVIVTTSAAPTEETLTDPNLQQLLSANPSAQPTTPGGQATIPGITRPMSEKVRKYEFTVQFIWKQTPLYLREERRREERNRAKATEPDQTPKVAERTNS
jgi:type IV pilus assembly protein PilM